MANHLEYGSIAVGAPGSQMRAQAESMDRKAEFLRVYREELGKAREANLNGEYKWPESELENVYLRMATAVETGSFSKDSVPFKNTCKRLKIKHTYQAIREFIGNVHRWDDKVKRCICGDINCKMVGLVYPASV